MAFLLEERHVFTHKIVIIFKIITISLDKPGKIVYNVITIERGGADMSSIVYQIDKKTGTKYAFESVSYWDKEKKQPRSKRKYLGKVDPETGEIIPSRGRAVHSDDTDAADKDILSALKDELKAKESTIVELRRDVEALSERNEKLLAIIREISTLTEGI